MASLNGLFSDPKKLTAVSDFLLGFSQGTQKANVPGASPFGAIGAGFAAGGVNVKDAATKRTQAELERQKLNDAHELAQANIKAKNAEAKERMLIEQRTRQYQNLVSQISINDPEGHKKRIKIASMFPMVDAAKADLSNGYKALTADRGERTLGRLEDAAESKADKEARELAVQSEIEGILESNMPLEEKRNALIPHIGTTRGAAAYRALKPAGEGLSVKVPTEDGFIEVSTGGTKKSAQEESERFAQMESVKTSLTEARNRVQEMADKDPTIFGTPGAFQKAAATSISGLGRMMDAMGAQDVVGVKTISNIMQKVTDAGWGDAVEDRTELVSALQSIAQVVTDKVPGAGRRLKAQVKRFEERVGMGETDPKAVLARLDSFIEAVSNEMMADFYSKTYGGVSGAIKNAPPDQLRSMPPIIMNNDQFLSWTKRIPPSAVPDNALTKEKLRYLIEHKNELSDEWRRVLEG
jgi:hypothetical protein